MEARRSTCVSRGGALRVGREISEKWYFLELFLELWLTWSFCLWESEKVELWSWDFEARKMTLILIGPANYSATSTSILCQILFFCWIFKILFLQKWNFLITLLYKSLYTDFSKRILFFHGILISHDFSWILYFSRDSISSQSENNVIPHM